MVWFVLGLITWYFLIPVATIVWMIKFQIAILAGIIGIIFGGF